MGALALWWVDGVESGDYGKPIIAAANPFTEFVPGHVLLAEFGLLICEQIWDQTAVPRVDDRRMLRDYSRAQAQPAVAGCVCGIRL